MPAILVNPMNEDQAQAAAAPRRLQTLKGAVIALLDISKPGGNIFLDRVEKLLRERHGVANVIRVTKPTFTKPAPSSDLEELRHADAVIEGLAD